MLFLVWGLLVFRVLNEIQVKDLHVKACLATPCHCLLSVKLGLCRSSGLWLMVHATWLLPKIMEKGTGLSIRLQTCTLFGIRHMHLRRTSQPSLLSLSHHMLLVSQTSTWGDGCISTGTALQRTGTLKIQWVLLPECLVPSKVSSRSLPPSHSSEPEPW